MFQNIKDGKNEGWYTFTAAFLEIIEYLMEATRLNKT